MGAPFLNNDAPRIRENEIERERETKNQKDTERGYCQNWFCVGNCGFGSRQAVQCIYILPKLAQTPEKGTRRGQKKCVWGEESYRGAQKLSRGGSVRMCQKWGWGLHYRDVSATMWGRRS